MKGSRRLVITAAALLVATQAHARTLATAPAAAGFGVGYDLECSVTNASPTSKARLTIEVRDYSGTVIDSGGPADWAPGEAAGLTAKPGGASCVFKIVSGNPKNLRAAAIYTDSNDNLVIIPAR